MCKPSNKNVATAALLFATAVAQGSTVTSYYPVCPTASSTTITLAKTITMCPGPYCNGPMVTPPPNGVGQPGVQVGEYTSVGPDGLTTVLGIWETVYNSMCETGLVPATYTITAPCPCEETPHPSVLPTGFETTVMPCHVCEANGGPSTVTLTQPCPTGPYASQTPSVDQSQSPAVALAAPMAGGSGAQASAGAGANASAGPGGAYATAGAGASAQGGSAPGGGYASAGAGAMASSGPGGSASANSGSGSGTGAGTSSPGQGIVNVIPVNGTTSRNGTAPMIPVPPALVASYMSTASKLPLAGFTLFAGIAAVFLL